MNHPGTAPSLEQIRAAIRKHLPPGEFRVVLFGSRARATGRAGSDWDIGLIGPRPARGAVLERIREDLDNLRTLHSFDVVDLSTVPHSFREHALDTGVDLR